MRARRSASGESLPLLPLLHAYTAVGLPSIVELHRIPGLGNRFAAILAATARFLYSDFLTRANEDTLRDVLARFYRECVTPPLHLPTLLSRAGFIRHALSHLLHGRDPAPRKLQAFLAGSGTYRVPGLGPPFWSALLQGLAPGRFPGWTALTRRGLERLGTLPLSAGAGPVEVYSALLQVHACIRAADPRLTSLHIDHFLSLVALMPGRNLHEGAPGLTACPVQPALARLRAGTPLRQRLKERGQAIAAAQEKLEAGLSTSNGKLLGDALATADPYSASRCSLDWGLHAETLTLWIGRLWESADPYPLLERFWQVDPLPAAGLWLPAAVLHLRDPQRFLPFSNPVQTGHARLDEGTDNSDPPAARYRLLEQVGVWLREQHTLHPLETPELLALLGEESPPAAPLSIPHTNPAAFHGFCPDTFTFLSELARENSRTWMDRQRGRYHFTVREPLTELCRALAERYIEPVLSRTHGWQLDTTSRTGKALTSICKNVFGKSLPYTSTLWITFCRVGQARAGAQMFVCLSPAGVRFGFRLGKSARQARAILRQGIEQHAENLHRFLTQNGAIESCLFGPADQPGAFRRLGSAEELREWAAGKTQEASCSRPASDAAICSEDLLGEIILTFDRLLCLFACTAEPNPAEVIVKLGGSVEGTQAEGFTEADFRRQTFLGDDWLRRTRDLLALKKQLILQGVPGTGKTHIARNLARLLTGNCDEACRLVQFHPAYSYEEFVEGIRVRTVNVDGRHDITYPVEDGLLCAFAARAASRPVQPHVLIIDEINRGNLPRIFGELLYLLEYRGQAVELPYSRRGFQLPANLYVLATMNGADRSIALIDQALRRRFSFVHMEPDASVLQGWLKQHPPLDGPRFAERVLDLFGRLNAKLRSEVGPQAQVGHSYFMVSALDDGRLRMIWQHQVRPLVEEFLAGQPGRIATFDQLLEGEQPRQRSRTTPAPL